MTISSYIGCPISFTHCSCSLATVKIHNDDCSSKRDKSCYV